MRRIERHIIAVVEALERKAVRCVALGLPKYLVYVDGARYLAFIAAYRYGYRAEVVAVGTYRVVAYGVCVRRDDYVFAAVLKLVGNKIAVEFGDVHCTRGAESAAVEVIRYGRGYNCRACFNARYDAVADRRYACVGGRPDDCRIGCIGGRYGGCKCRRFVYENFDRCGRYGDACYVDGRNRDFAGVGKRAARYIIRYGAGDRRRTVCLRRYITVVDCCDVCVRAAPCYGIVVGIRRCNRCRERARLVEVERERLRNRYACYSDGLIIKLDTDIFKCRACAARRIEYAVHGFDGYESSAVYACACACEHNGSKQIIYVLDVIYGRRIISRLHDKAVLAAIVGNHRCEEALYNVCNSCTHSVCDGRRAARAVLDAVHDGFINCRSARLRVEILTE